MKRWHLFLLTLLMVWLTAIPSQAQILRLGLRGGIDVVNMEFNSDLVNSSNRAGFFLGPTLHIATPLPFLSIDGSVLYDQRELKVADETITQKRILVPANVRAGVNLAGAVGIFVTAGPQLAFGVGSSSFIWEDQNGDANLFSLQDTKLSLNLGAGMQFGSHLEAGVYYNIPFGKTGDFSWDMFSSSLADQTLHHARTTSNAWSLSLTYLF